MATQKTALQQLIDILENQIEHLKKERMKISEHSLRIALDEAKKLLPVEQERMVDFAQDYKSHCFQNDDFTSARTFFNETYGTHE